MERRSKIILGILGVVLLGIIVTEVVRPKPINWRPSYTSISKIPFGCYILYSELSSIFPDTQITTVEESVYDALLKRDSSTLSNYVVINDIVSFDTQETNKLLHYVAKGNQVFISASQMYGTLADTLNIEIERTYDFEEDTITVSLTNRRFKNDTFNFERGVNPAYFKSVDTLNTQILGHVSFKDKSYLNTATNELSRQPNFIKTSFGKGSFLINTLPIGFTNYYLLRDNGTYASNSFSYLNKKILYWDDYKKSGRKVITSPLRFVLNQPALKWSYYLTLVGLLLFVIFRAKREQRIIPVIEPLQNSSVEFARTVGSLYHQNRDYKNLNEKKINYFLSFIRNNYHLDTSILDDKLINQITAKSGVSLTETKTLIQLIQQLKNKPIQTEMDTIALSKKINLFKQYHGR